MKTNTIRFIIFLLFLCSCSGRHENVMNEEDYRRAKEAMTGANRILVQNDKIKIQQYLKEHNLLMVESATGLWYKINYEGNGPKAEINSRVTLSYTISLLNGTRCYSSDSLGYKTFIVGKGGVESGLEEGVLLLREGSKATFIMPPHLAHGLTGDGNKIPARSIILYSVELLKVEP